jgi:hypothetical protein
MRCKLTIACVIASTAWTASIASAGETQAVTFNLRHATSFEAATVLRTIVFVKDLTLADDHTLTVHDTQKQLDLAAAVVTMLDTTDDTAATAPLSVDDGSLIATVVLHHASSQEVMAALRQELHFARVATASAKRILLRDTESQVQAALKVIARLERSRQQP